MPLDRRWSVTLGLSFVAAALLALLGGGNARADRPALSWSPWTRAPSPYASTNLDTLERRVATACGASEDGLRALARTIVARTSADQKVPDLETLDWEKRASGEPHPWPRTWTITGRSLEPERTTALLETWLRASRHAELRRCGVADGVAPNGNRVLVVVAVDALADLAPIRRTARVGEWLSVEVRLRAPVRDPRTLVLGPSGVPRALLTSTDGASVRARFAPDQSGMFTVQVLGDVGEGSRPLIEATVFADVEPPTHPDDERAPGEGVEGGSSNEGEGLASMVDAARTASGRAVLQRSQVLDDVARKHALRMSATQELAHDVGDGNPTERLATAGVGGVEVGENVGRARSVAMAHRQIWNSPSHRLNLLSDRFLRAGYAVVRDEHGEAWVVEEFAGR